MVPALKRCADFCKVDFWLGKDALTWNRQVQKSDWINPDRRFE